MFSVRSLAVVGTLALAFGIASPDARAAGALAGTDIQNTAEVTYSVGGINATATSNTVSVRVAEILDVVVTAQTPTVAVNAGDTAREIVYRVTNTGNGPETFRLVTTSVVGGDEFDPTVATPSIYFDTDASGDLSAADTPYVAGDNDPVLPPDASVTVLVVNDIPGTVVDGNRGFARLAADARTGSGAPGTAFASAGVGGTDAVVGLTGALASGQAEYLVTSITVNAVKSQVVVDQFGGSRPLPGARINYTIVVTATGSGSAASAQFTDRIPANTSFVPGSLRLNAGALSDVTDTDAGEYTTTPDAQVRVALGALMQASGAQTIEFAVVIN